MRTFKFVYKRRGDWFKRSHIICGFSCDDKTDRMSIYYVDGSSVEIPKWSDCYCWLGIDFVAFQQKGAEEKAGTKIQTNLG